MRILYTAHATATSGRNGYVETSDKHLMLELQGLDMPKKESGTATNPEQLFACAYAACFGSALEAVAEKQHVDVSNAAVTVHVSLLKEDTGGFRIGAEVDVAIPQLDTNTIQNLVNRAHEVCPYSKATRGNIEVTVKAEAA